MFIHSTVIYRVPSEARHCAVLETCQAGGQMPLQLSIHLG